MTFSLKMMDQIGRFPTLSSGEAILINLPKMRLHMYIGSFWDQNSLSVMLTVMLRL